ncbi:hypothetical protein BCV72DRAFT_217248, partial [Rhizopus microsporus var. microsporus]
INNQKGAHEAVKRLFDNSNKYDKSSTVGAKNQNPVPLPPAEPPSFSQWRRIIELVKDSFVKYERKTSCAYKTNY